MTLSTWTLGDTNLHEARDAVDGLVRLVEHFSPGQSAPLWTALLFLSGQEVTHIGHSPISVGQLSPKISSCKVIPQKVLEKTARKLLKPDQIQLKPVQVPLKPVLTLMRFICSLFSIKSQTLGFISSHIPPRSLNTPSSWKVRFTWKRVIDQNSPTYRRRQQRNNALTEQTRFNVKSFLVKICYCF